MDDEYEVEDKPKRHVFTPGVLERYGLTGGREVSSVVPQLPKEYDNGHDNKHNNPLPARGPEVKPPPVDDDEFNKAFLDMESMPEESLKQNQHVVYEESRQATRTTPRAKSYKPGRMPLTSARNHDRVNANSYMVGGLYGMFACDIEECRKLFQERDLALVKPRWAVSALVRFRDRGKCQVCTEVCGEHGKVVMRKSKLEGGKYDEYNCVFICMHCAQVWPRKNFYVSPSEELDMNRQYLYTLGKRGRGNEKGVKALGSEGMQRYKWLMSQVETGKIRLEEVIKGNVPKLRELRMTQDERVMAILGPLRNRNIDLSENDNNKTEGEESTG